MAQGTKIAGKLTVADWQKLSAALRAHMGSTHLWEKAYGYFEQRMKTRYLNPIQHIEAQANIEGEGFAITAIICSMIEALESFYQGRSYRRPPKGTQLNQNTEYFSSQLLFESFLQNREPFKKHFSNIGLATEFYENVRCAILHEAATRGGWKIRIDSNSLIEQQGNQWVLNRALFVQAVQKYMEGYKQELLSSIVLKEAFMRKFDAICASA